MEHFSSSEVAYLASRCILAGRGSDPPIEVPSADAPVSERVVRKAIEEGILHSLEADRVLLDRTAVLYLAVTKSLDHALLDRDVKTSLYDVLRTGREQVQLAPLVTLELGAMIRHSVRIMDSYVASTRRFIDEDPAVMGGLPVIKGTRIPVHTVLGRSEEGETVEQMAADWPHVEREGLEMALIYARTHPRRGRPRLYR